MRRFIVILVFVIFMFTKAGYSQEQFINIELSPILWDMVNSPFGEFKGFKINVPIYFKESWSVSPYVFINRRNLNAYDTYNKYYDNIAPTVFNFVGVRINKDYRINKPANFRIYGGFNYQIVTDKYFGTRVSSRVNPNVGGSFIWKFNSKVYLIVDVEVIKIVSTNSNDDVSRFIEKGGYVNGELGGYEFDGNETMSLSVGLVVPLNRRGKE